MSFSTNRKKRFVERKQNKPIALEKWLTLAKSDPSLYSSAYDRILKAIGKPEKFDTSTDARLSRIHSNKTINRYPAFKDFYGMEDTIEQIVSFFLHASQDLEESKQILYLLGPVGSAKSSLAEKLKSLMQQEPIYILGYKNDEGEFVASPVNDHPFCLVEEDDYEDVSEEYNIPLNTLKHHLASPWITKRLEEFEGDASKFLVKKMYPSINDRLAIAKTEPGDENNQDISSLVGKVDIRQLEEFAQNDADASAYGGSLNRANQGMMEFVEMFKAPIKVLHPLLTATQERNYNPIEGMAALPFEGIVLAHSNESEWQTFRNDKNNEAFLDRVYVVKVPYSLGVQENIKIFDKLLSNSKLSGAPCAPGTLTALAELSVLSRLVIPENSPVVAKMMVYDGQDASTKFPKAKKYQEYLANAGQDEGMSGISPRWGFKILSKVFNSPSDEISANPVHLFRILEEQILKEQWPAEVEEAYLGYITERLVPQYIDFVGKQIQRSFVESYDDLGQNFFDRYFLLADMWISNNDTLIDKATGNKMDRSDVNAELEAIEKPAGISNPKDFRNEVVNFVLRAKANSDTAGNPSWKSITKLAPVIEKKIFSNLEDMLPVISFSVKANKKQKQSHIDFVGRMVEQGYTETQVRILCEWWLGVRKSN